MQEYTHDVTLVYGVGDGALSADARITSLKEIWCDACGRCGGAASTVSEPCVIDIYDSERDDACIGVRWSVHATGEDAVSSLVGAAQEAAGSRCVDVFALPIGTTDQLRVVAFDMDSCVINHECINEMAAVRGKGDEVSGITTRAMRDGMDFDTSLRLRLGLLKGMKESELSEIKPRITYNSGVRRLARVLRQWGYTLALLSGGFTYFAHDVARSLDFDFAFSNELEFDEQRQLTGNVVGRIVNGPEKASVLQRIARVVDVDVATQGAAIGDGANDRWMVQAAAVGVAFHGKALLKSVTALHMDKCQLDALGILLYNQTHQQRAPLYRAEELVTLLP